VQRFGARAEVLSFGITLLEFAVGKVDSSVDGGLFSVCVKAARGDGGSSPSPSAAVAVVIMYTCTGTHASTLFHGTRVHV
jgi:hypothetical protein